MRIPDYVNKIVVRFAAAGRRAYPVGGCVRDTLLGKTPGDWDLTTDAPPQETLALFGDSAYPTGLKHGTVTVVQNGHSVEITTMRRDGAYLDKRHPESVMFTNSLTEDLARRDFTVNAMALTPDGGVCDPFGGQADLAARVLRCVGSAEERFEEDALRILRLLRFASVLGFSVASGTAEAAHAKRELLRSVAAERVYAELNKLLCGADAARMLLEFPDVLGVVIPEILPCVGFDQRNPHHCFDVWEHTARSVGAVPPRRELRWTMLFHDLGKPLCLTTDADGTGHFYGHTVISAQLAEGIMERLRFEKSLAAQVRAQLACFDDLFPAERAAIHREMARRGRAAGHRLSPSYSSGFVGGGFWADGERDRASVLTRVDPECFVSAGGMWTGSSGRRCPVVQAGAGASAVARWRRRSASGQAAAKARRTRLAVSRMRAPSFRRRSRRVANSAVARRCAFGMVSRTLSISQ